MPCDEMPTDPASPWDVVPRCDVCGLADEETEWCGDCGCCVEHCQQYITCRLNGV